MDIAIEWQGFSGLIKLLLIFFIPLIIGFLIGRKIG
tara:strand:+ start:599 stop:706 length:108 start_codon:yes stop_codon:yes gene_type:complete